MLSLFVISQSVCPWQAFPAWSKICGQGQEPTRVEKLKGASLRYTSALRANVILDWKGWLGTNALTYYEKM